MNALGIAKNLEIYISRQFDDCDFKINKSKVVVVKDIDLIIITLYSGNFDALVKGKGDNKNVTPEVVLTSDGSVFAFVDDISPNKLTLKNTSQKMSKETTDIFKKIAKHIKDNYDNKEVMYSFRISYFYDNTRTSGIIAKPTEIEHKTFRGRKRRGGVVEKAINENVEKHIHSVWDNEGESIDRYTIILKDEGYLYSCDTPNHPQGVCGWGDDIKPGSHLGKKISFNKLPQKVKDFVRDSILPGTIPDPTKIEHKTAKRPKRRGIVEKVKIHQGDDRGIVKSIESFLSKKLNDCDFMISSNPYGGVVYIHLTGGPFKPYKSFKEGSGNSGNCRVRASNTGFTKATYDELDIRMIRDDENKRILSSEAIRVFEAIIKFIQKSLTAFPETTYGFYISGFEITDDKAGTIPKPTKIDHKTFKGRKRKGVVEAILGRLS